jgi:hypothetical protein
MTGSRSQNGIIAPLGLRQAFRTDGTVLTRIPQAFLPKALLPNALERCAAPLDYAKGLALFYLK